MLTPVRKTVPEAMVARENDGLHNNVWKFHVLTQTVCVTLATLLFFLRCYVRLGLSKMKRQWLLEDCTLLLDPHITFSANSCTKGSFSYPS